ncbi:hypothetical protein VPHD479_0194 [Vibrio phage D479]
MIEIVGSKYCGACGEYKRRLERDGFEYKWYDTLNPCERGNELVELAADDGYENIPLVFYKNECIGSGIGTYNRLLQHKGILPDEVIY